MERAIEAANDHLVLVRLEINTIQVRSVQSRYVQLREKNMSRVLAHLENEEQMNVQKTRCEGNEWRQRRRESDGRGGVRGRRWRRIDGRRRRRELSVKGSWLRVKTRSVRKRRSGRDKKRTGPWLKCETRRRGSGKMLRV